MQETTNKNDFYDLVCFIRRLTDITAPTIWNPIGIWPDGWCFFASRALGKLLAERGHSGFSLASGTRGEHSEKSHVWLQRGDLIVDITADQFEQEDTLPVLVTTDSAWHSQWDTEFTDPEIDSLDGIADELYQAITQLEEWKATAA